MPRSLVFSSRGSPGLLPGLEQSGSSGLEAEVDLVVSYVAVDPPKLWTLSYYDLLCQSRKRGNPAAGVKFFRGNLSHQERHPRSATLVNKRERSADHCPDGRK